MFKEKGKRLECEDEVKFRKLYLGGRRNEY